MRGEGGRQPALEKLRAMVWRGVARAMQHDDLHSRRTFTCSDMFGGSNGAVSHSNVLASFENDR